MIETTYTKQDSILTILPSGRLDSLSSPELERDLARHLDGVQDIIMDLASVEYVSSGGIRMMLATEQLLEKHGGKLKVLHVNPYILEVFDMVGFTDVIEVIRD